MGYLVGIRKILSSSAVQTLRFHLLGINLVMVGTQYTYIKIFTFSQTINQIRNVLYTTVTIIVA